MRNILVVFSEKNQQNLPEVLSIVRECSSNLHGIFLQHDDVSADFLYPFLDNLDFTKSSHKKGQQKNECLVQKIEMVRKACECEGIQFDATIYDEPCLDQLVDESASADLLLLDTSLNLKEYFISSINVCLTDILLSLRCPVKMFSSH